MHVYVLLAIESYDGQDMSFEDTSAQLDDIKCSLHGSLEAAKGASQRSFDESLGDHLKEGEDRELLDWHAEGQACQPPPEPKNWYAGGDLYSAGYREYQIRLLPLSDS
jgi:hypothetical protein